MNVISEYWSDDQTRHAQVRHEAKGFYVVMSIDNEVQEIRDLFDHSVRYAEDCCENFVMEWGEWNKDDSV